MTVTVMNEGNPYRAAGTYCGLSYIPRKADEKLFNAILENQRYPYCLAPRQSGKSSLLANIENKLSNDFHSIFIDLSILPPKGLNDFDEFLSFLSHKILSSLNINKKTNKFLELSELINFAVNSTEKRIIIFVDEIDVLLLSTFKDQFFGQVRSIFNARSRYDSLKRVQFVLAGAAQPTELISTVNMSPFNVGIQIELENLSKEQVISATSHLNFEKIDNQINVGNRIFYHTNGSVYLTQLILERLWDEREKFELEEVTTTRVDKIVAQILSEAQNEVHFINIYNQLLNNKELLDEFNLFRNGQEIKLSSLKELKMIGITDGTTPFRNLIYEEVFTFNKYLSLSVSSAKIYFSNVPFSSKGREFIGRKGKIEEIRNLLNETAFSSSNKGVSINGFGGLGKTQLAVEYAYATKDEYPNGVYWLVADENIDNQLLQIGDKKGWLKNFDKTVNQLEIAKANFFALNKCLILFDNVEEYTDIKDYLPNIRSDAHILITSRYKEHSFREIYLKLLDRDESRELLLKITNRSLEDKTEKEYLEKILEILGDIPLAIELVGGYLAEHENVTFAKYHQFLNEIPLDTLEKEFPEGSFTNHDRSIIQTLRISERTIKEKPLMVKILKVLAWSGSSSMGISLLQALVEAESEFEFETALGDAFKLRLLKKDEDAERYAIHRLLAKVIRHEVPLERQNEWHQKIVGNIESWFDKRKEEFNYLAEFEAEIEHLNEWQNHTIKHLPKQSVWVTALESYPLWQRGNYQKSLQLLEKSFSLYESEKVNNIELLANIQNDLGVIYGELGKYHEALKYKEKALTLRKDLFGEKHPDTAESYNNVGSTYAELGKHQEALKYKEKALELRKELLGEKHHSTAESYNNVGSTYGHLGKQQEALKYKEKALKIYQELFGEKHPDTATSYNNVGFTYGELGKHQEALKYKEKALTLRKDLFGEKHPDTATSYNNVGFTYGELGKHQEALKYEEKAVELRQELLGKQHPKTIDSVGNLIITYSKLGDKDKAGKKAAEFLGYVPQNNSNWKWFEEISRPYRAKKKRHSKRKR